MSSILKALKKLENEVKDQSDGQLNPKQFRTKKEVQKRSKTSSLFNKRFFIITASLIVIVGGGMILKFKPSKKQQPRIVQTVEKPEPKPVNLDKKSTPLPVIPKEKTLLREYDKKSESITKAEQKPPKPAAEPQEMMAAFFGKRGNKSAKSESASEQKASARQSPAKDTFSWKKKEKIESEKDTKRFESIPIKHAGESMFELQAISWASNPKKRMVVINNRIVREGESVEDALVKHIGKDEVVFKKGREEWRQLFRFAAND